MSAAGTVTGCGTARRPGTSAAAAPPATTDWPHRMPLNMDWNVIDQATLDLAGTDVATAVAGRVLDGHTCRLVLARVVAGGWREIYDGPAPEIGYEPGAPPPLPGHRSTGERCPRQLGTGDIPGTARGRLEHDGFTRRHAVRGRLTRRRSETCRQGGQPNLGPRPLPDVQPRRHLLRAADRPLPARRPRPRVDSAARGCGTQRLRHRA